MNEEAKSVEVSAPSVEEAIEKGLAQLGKSRDEVEIEVISEGKRGWFIFGGEQARVRLTVKKPPSLEELASRVLADIVRKMGFKARVETRIGHDMVGDEKEEPPLVLNVVGRDLGMLIGRKGENLAALQLITRLIVNKHLKRRANIVVDVENYKARRWRSLTRLAHKMADRVAKTRRPVALEPMPPYERRIIHLALRNHPVVTTRSVGEGDKRRVTIILREEQQ